MIGGQKYMIGFHFLIFRAHDPSLMLEFKQGLPWSAFLGTGVHVSGNATAARGQEND